jgi:hypothetical protein
MVVIVPKGRGNYKVTFGRNEAKKSKIFSVFAMQFPSDPRIYCMKKKKRQTYHLFDKVFKRLVHNCPRLLIHLINGSFGTNYPLKSRVTFSDTEYVSKSLKTMRSDVMVTIGKTTTYHLEAQTNDDKEMVLRVFQYGFYESERTKTIKDNVMILRLPQAKVFFLESTKKPLTPMVRISLYLNTKYANT